jgi:hypothetical protein
MMVIHLHEYVTQQILPLPKLGFDQHEMMLVNGIFLGIIYPSQNNGRN